MLEYEPILELAVRIRRGKISSAALTEHCLDRIASLDPRLHAFLAVTRDRALQEARAADQELREGHDRGPLHGIPYAAKDLFGVKGLPTTGGTRLLSGNVAREDCTAVRRLSAAGMVLLGKTHTVQFAFGLVGTNADQGNPLNPWHAAPHAPGGSSSGSAVAVAAGLAPAALGTDTGGSVRVPAALCGIVGLKTTVGRVSRAGVYPLSRTLDSVGPLARSVEDAAWLYAALSGPDSGDPSTAGIKVEDPLPTLEEGVVGLRLAFGETVFFDDVDPEVEDAVRTTGEVFRSLGASVTSIELPEVAELVLEKNRGLFVAHEACEVNRDLLDRHFDELDPNVARRMITGRDLEPNAFEAMKQRYLGYRERLSRTLAGVDALLMPASMLPARPIAPLLESPEAYRDYNLKLNRNAGIGNVLDLCGVSLPCGFTSAGLPIGLLVSAKPFHEAMALRVARAYERATSWHERRPDLSWAAPRGGSTPSPGAAAPRAATP
ncbi:MAG TPA: amidase [Candidatus Eisenbacteria bacterium]|nr:amidase [Candidatus Eisenbacteria bacterium]